MSRFLAGFLTASFLWVAAGYAYLEGYLDIELAPLQIAGEGDVDSTVIGSGQDSRTSRRKRKYRRNRSDGPSGRGPGATLSGDHLGQDEIRDVDLLAGSGEEQLTGREIEQGIDSVFGTIRRCLILVADEDPVTGRIVFGMRIGGTGQVTKVNLRGPASIVAGEAGSCLRSAVRGIRYRSFDGPDMIVHYPLTLE